MNQNTEDRAVATIKYTEVIIGIWLEFWIRVIQSNIFLGCAVEIWTHDLSEFKIVDTALTNDGHFRIVWLYFMTIVHTEKNHVGRSITICDLVIWAMDLGKDDVDETTIFKL